jgi:hypothetical protein
MRAAQYEDALTVQKGQSKGWEAKVERRATKKREEAVGRIYVG